MIKFRGLTVTKPKKHRKLYEQFKEWEQQPKDHQQKSAEITQSEDNWIPWTLVDPELYQKAFPIHLIAEYVNRPFKLIGTGVYDDALRVQCDLLQQFFVFHLQQDFKFHPKISASKAKIIDPFTRIQIRQGNRKDHKIIKKYFNDNFNLKQFVFKLYENYFPNVTWRYIGAEHFAHRITLQITEFLYKVGLWSYEDNQELIAKLLEKSENLITLEKAVEKDLKKPGVIIDVFKAELKLLFRDMKKSMSLILIHSILMINDESLKESLAWSKTGQGLFKRSKGGRLWDHVYFKDKEINHLINSILLKYLMRVSPLHSGKDLSVKKLFFPSKETQNYIDDLFMITSSVDFDVMHVSNLLVNPEILRFRKWTHGLEKRMGYPFGGRFGHLKGAVAVNSGVGKKLSWLISGNDEEHERLQRTTARSMKTGDLSQAKKGIHYPPSYPHFLIRAYEIKQELISLLNRILSGKVPASEPDNLQLRNQVNDIALSIRDYLRGMSSTENKGKRQSRETQRMNSRFNRQLALGDQNIITVILTLARVLTELQQDKALQLILNSLTKICVDNVVNQAQLFGDQSLVHYQYLNRRKPLIGSIMTTSIFESNNKILYANPEVFNIVFAFYKAQLERLELDIEKIDLKGDQVVDAISRILSVHRFNDYFGRLFVQIENLGKMEKGRYYELAIQKLLVYVVSQKVLPILSDSLYLPKRNKNLTIGQSSEYDFKFNFINSRADSNQILRLVTDAPHMRSRRNLKSYIYECCLSLLILFNKVTSRIVVGSTYHLTYYQIAGIYQWKTYQYLLKFKEGLVVRREIIKLYTTFFFFAQNHLITTRISTFKDHNVIYKELMIPIQMREWDAIEIICEELSHCTRYLVWKQKKDREVDDYLRKLFFEGILVMIYKYVAGLSSLFVIDRVAGNTGELSSLQYNVNTVFDQLGEKGETITQIVNINFEEGLNKQLTGISTKIKNDLTVKDEENLDGGDGGEQSGQSQQRELNKSPSQFGGYDGIDYGDMDRDEVIWPDLYEFRKKAENIIYFIEEKYPKSYRPILNRMFRATANKRLRKKKSELMVLAKLKQYYSIGVDDPEQNQGRISEKIQTVENDEKLNKHSAFRETLKKKFSGVQEVEEERPNKDSKEFKEFSKVRSVYQEEKEEWLLKRGDDNPTISFLVKNKKQIGNSVKFLVESIYKEFKKREHITRKEKEEGEDDNPGTVNDDNVSGDQGDEDHYVTEESEDEYSNDLDSSVSDDSVYFEAPDYSKIKEALEEKKKKDKEEARRAKEEAKTLKKEARGNQDDDSDEAVSNLDQQEKRKREAKEEEKEFFRTLEKKSGKNQGGEGLPGDEILQILVSLPLHHLPRQPDLRPRRDQGGILPPHSLPRRGQHRHPREGKSVLRRGSDRV